MEEPDFLKDLDKPAEADFVGQMEKPKKPLQTGQSQMVIQGLRIWTHFIYIAILLTHIIIFTKSLLPLNIWIQLGLLWLFFVVGFIDKHLPKARLSSGYRRTSSSYLYGAAAASLVNYLFMSNDFTLSRQFVLNVSFVHLGIAFFALYYLRLLGFYTRQRFKQKV